MKINKGRKVSRVQPVELAFAAVLTCVMWSDNTQSSLAKAESLLQLEMIATSIIRSWNQNKERDDSDNVKNP